MEHYEQVYVKFELKKNLNQKVFSQKWILKMFSTKCWPFFLLSRPQYDYDSCVFQVPSLRYNLTAQDYERDREADMERVQQMLEEVQEAQAAKCKLSRDSRIIEGTLEWFFDVRCLIWFNEMDCR